MAADKNDKNAKDVNEELHEELHEGFGEVNLGESGLDLPIDLNEPAADETPVHNPVTPEDLAALAQVEAELNERWNETHIDPTLDRIRELMGERGQHPRPRLHRRILVRIAHQHHPSICRGGDLEKAHHIRSRHHAGLINHHDCGLIPPQHTGRSDRIKPVDLMEHPCDRR